MVHYPADQSINRKGGLPEKDVQSEKRLDNLLHCPRVMVDSEIRYVGPGLTGLWQTHDALEANLVTAGRGVYFLNTAQHDLSPGTLVWLLPNQSRRLMPGPDLEIWVLTCSSDRFEREVLDDVARHPCRILAREDATSLDRLFTHVSQDADDPRLFRSAIDYAVRSARHISVSGADALTAPPHPAVATALRILREWPDVPSAAALAAKCGVSQIYLGELLREQTGRGFVEWRNRSRLERFQILYPESGDLLTAALAAGFGSYIQFHRVFARIVGVTPGEWAKGSAQGAPPVTDFSSAPDRPSNRMIWYALAELVIPGIRCWLDDGFADALDGAIAIEAPPLESGVSGAYDLRRYQADLVRSVAAVDLANARLLEEAFARLDLFAAYSYILTHWEYFGLEDLAIFVTVHVALAWMGANRKAPPSTPAMHRLLRKVRSALATNSRLTDATIEERQRVVAAISAQGYILRSAMVAARAARRRDIWARFEAGIRATMMSTYGWDPTGSELPG